MLHFNDRYYLPSNRNDEICIKGDRYEQIRHDDNCNRNYYLNSIRRYFRNGDKRWMQLLMH